MSDLKMKGVADTEIADSRWKDLYKIGGAAAIIAAISLLIEVIVFAVWPIPTTVMGYFILFKSNSLLGLLEFYLLQVVAYIFFIPMFLAIYAALRRVNESYMALAMIFAFIGITVFLQGITRFPCFL